MVEPVNNKILFATFNQDVTCLAIGTETGFIIYNTNPFKEVNRENLNGGIGIIEMLNRCGLMALVGGGQNPKYEKNKVILWQSQLRTVNYELRFKGEISAVRLKCKKIIIASEDKIYIYSMSMELIDNIITMENRKGLLATALDMGVEILAFPGKEVGQIVVRNYDVEKGDITITAHQSHIGCIAINFDGTLLATASEKGTLIRLFRTKDGTNLQELRRGTSPAEISSISFENKNRFLLCTSSNGTVHIFSLKDEKNGESNSVAKNQTSWGGWFAGMVGIKNNYLNSEWSFAQFRINMTIKNIGAFGTDNTIIVVTMNGKFFKAQFTEKGGECTKLIENDISLEGEDDTE